MLGLHRRCVKPAGALAARRCSGRQMCTGRSGELARLVRLARPERGSIGLAVGLLAVSSGVTLAVPFGFGRVIDTTLDKSSGQQGVTDRLRPVSLALGGLFVLGALANAGRVMLMERTSQRLVASLRRQAFGAIMRMELSAFDRRSSGELVNRLSSDTVVVGRALADNISSGLRSAAQGLAAGGMMTFMSPALTGTVLTVVPPIAIGGVFYSRMMKRISGETQDALAASTAQAEQRIGNIRTVRAFAMEEPEVERYAERVEAVYDISLREARARAVFFGSVGLAGNSAMLAVLWHGGHLLDAGAITVGELTAFMLYTLYVGTSITGLASFQSEMMKGLGASSRLFQLLDTQPALPPPGSKRSLDNVNGEICFNDVHFTYPTRPDAPVLKGLSLAVPAGLVTAVVGASGSGKSTLGALLLGLYPLDSGSIALDGVEIQELELEWLRGSVVGLVSQEPVLFSGSIAENISYSQPTASHEAIQQAATSANAADFIDELPDGYETQVGERGLALSGGQKQRIAIARALLKDPSVLVLDEATSALDSASERLVQQALGRLMRGRTVVVIAHRMSTIQAADRIAVMHNGRIAEVGTLHELDARPDGLFRRIRRHAREG